MAEYLPIPMGDIIDFAAENLPEDYEIQVIIRAGCLDVDLINPEGKYIEVCQDDVQDVAEMVRRCVNRARKLDGLGPVDFKGESIPAGLEDDRA